MVKRLVLFIVLSCGIWLADAYYHSLVAPDQSAQNAVAALNGGEQQAENVRAYEWVKSNLTIVCVGLEIALVTMCFAKPIKRGMQNAQKEIVKCVNN